MENSRDELTKFKTDINLVSFAMHYAGYEYKTGYKNKNAESTTIVLVKDDKLPTEEHLLIRQNPTNNQYIYYNPENPEADRGSIVDFCSNKLNLNLGETRKLCREYLGEFSTKQDTIKRTLLVPSPPLKQNIIDEKYFAVQPFKDTSYLESRFLNKNVINSPLFLNTMGIKTIQHVKEDGTKTTFENTAFLIKNIEGKTIGLSLKNKIGSNQFTGNLDQSQTLGMWMSTPPLNTSKITFGITEHPIDALSHYQLHADPLTDKNPMLYFSSNGNLRKSHIDFVQHFINLYKPKEVLLLNDNDFAGMRFNITYLGQLKTPGHIKQNTTLYSEDIRIKCYYAKPSNVLSLEVFNVNKMDNKEIIENINDAFNDFNSDLYKAYKNKPEEFEIKSIVQTEVLTEVKVTFDNRLELLKEAMAFTQILRPNDLIKVELPKSKDYNQDLENIMTKNKSTSFTM